MISSCSIMWKVKERSPISWSGEAVAPASVAQPAAKSRAPRRSVARPWSERRHKRMKPIA